jgi:ribosome-binding factor A
MSNERQARLADRIRVLIAERLEKGLRDPRLGFVTITDVRVTGDLQHASVFYTVYGDDQAREDSAAALKAATGMLRSEVGKQLGIRLTRRSSSSPTRCPRTRAHRAAAAQAQERDAAVAGSPPAPRTRATPTRTSSRVRTTTRTEPHRSLRQAQVAVDDLDESVDDERVDRTIALRGVGQSATTSSAGSACDGAARRACSTVPRA